MGKIQNAVAAGQRFVNEFSVGVQMRPLALRGGLGLKAKSAGEDDRQQPTL
jgi:epoxyqueuosine reductase QueG